MVDAIEFDKFENPVENILNENADLVLLDINLPFSDGKFICNEIRKVSDVPIIMITSMNNDIDELISLNYGADQYVTKPFIIFMKEENKSKPYFSLKVDNVNILEIEE